MEIRLAMTVAELIIRLKNAFEATFREKLKFTETLSRVDYSAWDSLHHVVFIISIEKEFGVRFDGTIAVKLNSIPIIIDHLKVILSES